MQYDLEKEVEDLQFHSESLQGIRDFRVTAEIRVLSSTVREQIPHLWLGRGSWLAELGRRLQQTATSQALQHISVAAWGEKSQSLKERERLMKDITPGYSGCVGPRHLPGDGISNTCLISSPGWGGDYDSHWAFGLRSIASLLLICITRD